jgi:serine acetyltransferase
MPGVNISGEVIINENVYVGTGAKIINQLEIGSNSIIGAGAVVSKSIPDNCTAVGIPAKPIKFHNSN